MKYYTVSFLKCLNCLINWLITRRKIPYSNWIHLTDASTRFYYNFHSSSFQITQCYDVTWSYEVNENREYIKNELSWLAPMWTQITSPIRMSSRVILITCIHYYSSTCWMSFVVTINLISVLPLMSLTWIHHIEY